MKRYKIGSVKFGGYYTKEDPEGAWVNYEDVADLPRSNEVTDEMIEAGARALFGIACQIDFVLQSDLQAKVRKFDTDEKWASNDAFYRRTARIVIEAALKAENT